MTVTVICIFLCFVFFVEIDKLTGYITLMISRMKMLAVVMIIHPSTKQAQQTATTSSESNVLALSQARTL